MKISKIIALNTKTNQEEEITIYTPENEQDIKEILNMGAEGSISIETNDAMHEKSTNIPASASGKATFKSFPGHRGRPGKRGGSLPKGMIPNEPYDVDDESNEYWKKIDKPGPVTVYHGTKLNAVEDIIDNGLKRGTSWFHRGKSVYFCASMKDAMEWGNWAFRNGPHGSDKHAIIVEFEIPDEMDKDVYHDPMGAHDLETPTAFRVERDIPPEYIKSIKDYKATEIWPDTSLSLPFVAPHYDWNVEKVYYTRPEKKELAPRTGFIVVLVDEEDANSSNNL